MLLNMVAMKIRVSSKENPLPQAHFCVAWHYYGHSGHEGAHSTACLAACMHCTPLSPSPLPPLLSSPLDDNLYVMAEMNTVDLFLQVIQKHGEVSMCVCSVCVCSVCLCVYVCVCVVCICV